MSNSIKVRAKWLWTGTGPVQRDGCVEVDLVGAEGLLEAETRKRPGDFSEVVRPFEEPPGRLRVSASKNEIDLGNYCIVPGLVNSHSHLELSDFDAPLPVEGSFGEWLGSVVQHRRANPGSDGVARGLEESRGNGVKLILDVAHPREQPTLAPVDRQRFAFSELIGTTNARAKQTWRAALREERRHRSLNFGLSPHAPYTTTPRLIEKAVARSRKLSYPIMMHLAESRDEIEWLRIGSGRLQEFMEQAVGPDLLTTGYRVSLAEYTAKLVESPCAFLVHGNYLDEEALRILESHRDRMAVVHCPRTHAHFGHDANPLSELRRRGIRVVLGTDSRASNPDLSILDEARAVRRIHPTIAAEEIMAMVTTEPIRQLQNVAPTTAVGWSLIPCDESNSRRVLDAILEDDRSAI